MYNYYYNKKLWKKKHTTTKTEATQVTGCKKM